MQQAAETGAADNLPCRPARILLSQRGLEPEAPVRPREVVVLDVLDQDAPEMTLTRDQQPSNASRRAEPIQRSQTAFARGAR